MSSFNMFTLKRKMIRLLLIGCGNLGRALLKAWEGLEKHREIIVVQPSLSAQKIFPSFSFVADVKDLPPKFNPDLAVLAFKPQHIKEALPVYVPFLKESLVVSFLAGVSLEVLGSYFKEHSRLLRVMPNIAMQVGKSVNLMYTPHPLSLKDRASLENILKPTGTCLWLEKEELMEALTPISGSGPAYFFLLAEILVSQAVNLGLKRDAAYALVQETFLGSALLTSSSLDFKNMISAVASKGGVTEAALNVLNGHLPLLMQESLSAALKKIKELSSSG